MQTKPDRSLSEPRRVRADHARANAGHFARVCALSFMLPLLPAGWSGAEAGVQTSSIQFLPRNDYTTGSLPISAAFGDLNGDGNLDLAVANDGSNSVSVFLGDGSGGVGPKTDIPADNGPHAVAIGDMNGDGKPDLVVANYASNTVSILLGLGDGTFSPAHQYPTGTAPYWVALADLNADGKLDLATANSGSNSATVMLGDGAGGISSSAQYGAGAGPSSVAIADFNGDGKPDLVLANTSANTVSVLLADGAGSFGTKTDYPTGSTPWSVVTGDWNQDGHPDLAVSNFGSSSVSILLGTGLGGFGPKSDYSTGGSPRSLAAGDINGDGKLDLAVPNQDPGTVSVLLGNAAGGFAPRTDFSTGVGPYSAAIGDLNKDGFPDLVTTNTTAGTISVLLQINPGLPTDVTLTSNPNPSTFGDPVLLTAGVTPASATGGISFLEGSTVLGTASLISGAATFSVSGLNAGTHFLTARYGGDATYEGNTSPAVSQVVNKAATTLQLASSPNPSLLLEEVTFTATLSFTGGAIVHPTGTVQFKIDGANSGPPVSINFAGTARLLTSALALGDHTVQAFYSGDPEFASSISPTVSQHVAGPNPTIVAVRDVPNDQGGRVFLTWRSPLDKPGVKVVTGYRVWRRAPNPGVDALRAAPAGEVDPRGEPSRSRVIRTTLPDGTQAESFWEALATLPAEQLVSYAYEAPTTQDSMADNNPFTAFFVTSLTADPFVFFASAQDSGYSVDNLSPPTPAPFAALYLPGSTALHWTVSPAQDFSEFRLYRGISPNFVPGPSNLVIATRDTGYVDVIQTPYVYKLAATDVHGNASRYAVVTPNGAVATLASLVAIDAQPDRIRLTWYAAGNPGLTATVYRRTPTTAWTALGQIASDGTGYLRYEDTSVLTGARYGYRLGIQDGGTELFLGEAWATAEAQLLALEGARPNPATGGALTVAFTLPNAETASLELIDVSGRRLAAREVGSLGAGRHSVGLGDDRRVPPGIYLVRLTRGGSHVTRRVAVLP